MFGGSSLEFMGNKFDQNHPSAVRVKNRPVSMANAPTTQREQFIPLHAFLSKLPQADGFPYPVELSFLPLLEYLEEKAQSSEQPLKGLFQKLHRQIAALQSKIADGQLP